MKHEIIHGECLQTLKTLPDNSVDSIVTDPPAGIGFMGKEWDKDKGGRDSWIAWMQEIAVECKRVLKHGGHAFVWSLPRTSHWTAMAWENAGFEPRDRVAHVFGSGFPKSHDIGKAIDKEAGAVREVVGFDQSRWRDAKNHKSSTIGRDFNYYETKASITAPATPDAAEWEGWGTALKPAVEDWWLFRKPIAERTVAQNVLKYGTGALNIDACRVPTQDETGRENKAINGCFRGLHNNGQTCSTGGNGAGRFPANLILDDSDEVRECFPDTFPSNPNKRKNNGKLDDRAYGKFGAIDTEGYSDGDTNASRFFKRIIYCAKASKSERNKGADNDHPTVKPVALMQYLILMITPKGGTVLDAFAGSGTTGVAAKSLGFGFIGLEREGEYVDIARARIAATTPNAPDLFTDSQD